MTHDEIIKATGDYLRLLDSYLDDQRVELDEHQLYLRGIQLHLYTAMLAGYETTNPAEVYRDLIRAINTVVAKHGLEHPDPEEN